MGLPAPGGSWKGYLVVMAICLVTIYLVNNQADLGKLVSKKA
jgi:hypothetical protein